MKKILTIIIMSLFCFSLIACTKKSENGLMLKTYEYLNNEKNIEKIILKEKTIKFVDVNFTDAFNTLAQISVSKELGQNLNNTPQEDIINKIESTVNEFISQAALKNNTEYSYTYNSVDKTITLTSGSFKFNIEIIETKKNMYLKFYHNEFK